MNEMVLAEKSKDTIENFSNDTLNAIITLENTNELNQVLNSSEDAVKAMSSIMAQGARKVYSANFHNSLNIFEKHGFIKSSKKKMYEFKSTLIATTAGAAIPILIHIGSTIHGTIKEKQFIEYFLAWIGYINHTPITPLMRGQAQKIIQATSFKSDNNELYNIINEYSVKDSPNELPHLKSNSSLNSNENDLLMDLAKIIIAPCDLSLSDTKDRALQFLEECFVIPHSEAEKILGDISASQDYHIQLTGISDVSFMTVFSKFASSITEAYELGKYNEEMDIYAQKRKQRLDTIKNIAVGGVQSAVTGNPAILLKELSVPLRRDLLDTNTLLMNDVFNEERNLKKSIELKSTAKELWEKGSLK